MNDKFDFLGWVRQVSNRFFRELSSDASAARNTTKIQGCHLATASEADKPRDTINVADVSGSMGGSDYPPTRLDGGIKVSVEYVDKRIEQSPNDRVAVVSFNSTARIVLPLTPITNKEKIVRVIRKLTAGGGTDIAEGLKAAAEIFEAEPQSNRQRHIITLTDGQGGRPLKIAGKLKTEYRVIINVVGIGGSPSDVNESLLRKVATTDPDGFCHYCFIKDTEALSEHYRQLATGIVWRGKEK